MYHKPVSDISRAIYLNIKQAQAGKTATSMVAALLNVMCIITNAVATCKCTCFHVDPVSGGRWGVCNVHGKVKYYVVLHTHSALEPIDQT